ncbi:hypothetical protein [Pediococcus argentinicus]|uniref:Uncharacterized protein n=1 Tax=Pediococcus argentinicus TaxID=480391 RepID=A0A0R2NFQ3_9LACO|nr:hypothetical protein [Pediococcus argentinicus]KRO24670.1 hypothetical protein IV88_GL000800 [Pediococcus argentinicus]NKZ22789.1 DUF2892 domain-containing protein [Pediococcus argentinicus]GEP19834.1 hypothetical protein LSA03_12180 [Pediococcus argentinicus]
MSELENHSQNEEEFATALLTPWVKGKVSVDDNFLRMNIPNTILFNLIPAGKRSNKTPISTISNISSSTKYKLPRMIIGAIIVIIGFSMLSSSAFAALIAMILGVFIVGSGIQTIFEYENMGNSKQLEFPFYEANHVSTFVEHVSGIVEKHYMDANN